MAYVAYHFHWQRDEIPDLPHRERHRWVEEISKINKKINETTPSAPAAQPQQSRGPNFRSTPGGGIQWVKAD